MTYFELLDNRRGNLLGDFDSLTDAVKFALEYLPDGAFEQLRVLKVDGNQVAVALEGAGLKQFLAPPETLPTVVQASAEPDTSLAGAIVLRPAGIFGYSIGVIVEPRLGSFSEGVATNAGLLTRSGRHDGSEGHENATNPALGTIWHQGIV